MYFYVICHMKLQVGPWVDHKNSINLIHERIIETGFVNRIKYFIQKSIAISLVNSYEHAEKSEGGYQDFLLIHLFCSSYKVMIWETQYGTQTFGLYYDTPFWSLKAPVPIYYKCINRITKIGWLSKNVPFVFYKSKSNRFGKTQGWVNDAKFAFNLMRGTFSSQMVANDSISV